jgi:hypothetical protein
METAVDTGAAAPVSEIALPDAPAAAPMPVTIVETPKVTIDDTLRAAWDKANPPRQNGKFAPKADKATEGEPAAEAPPLETKSAEQPAEKAPEPATPAIEVPISWSAEMKAKWASLPPDAQSYIVQRDKETQQAISRIGNEKKGLEERVASYQPIDQLIDKHRDEFSRRGVAPAQAFETLLNAQRSLDENPLLGLVQIGLTYGIDLRQFLPQQVQSQIAAPAPEVVQLKNTVSRLESYLTEHQRSQEAAKQAEFQQTENALRSEIETFSKDKPHFEAVKAHMSALLTSGAADTLQKAYDQAVWAIPEIRERIQMDQRKADDEKRLAEQAKVAAAAKKSASVNVKSATASGNTPKTMDETLREIAGKRYGT